MEHRRDVPGGDLWACTASSSSGGQESACGGQGVWAVPRDSAEDATVRGAARLSATATNQAAQAWAVAGRNRRHSGRREPQLAEQWRYRDTETPGTAILGDGDEIPSKRGIRDFIAQVRQSAHSKFAEIHYSSHFDPSHVSFTDRGKRIDVWQAQDEAAVLAALQLGVQKWGTLTIIGPDEFKQLCAELAAQQGFKISNPELRGEIVRGPSEGRPVPVIPAGMPSPSKSYQLHKADILNRIEVRNASQLDWMIAVRMRVTGHDQQAVTQALKENASLVLQLYLAGR